MNEFIEKLIGRLEEEKKQAQRDGSLSFAMGFKVAISIVDKLAEEHKGKTMIDGQYCWQTCGATEHCKECNRLCNGSIDYYENYDCLVEE